MSAPRCVLVGAPGAGKSTIGALLAEQLGVRLRDTDADVEASTGSTVAEVFLDHGEERFRELERAAVAFALAEHDGVVALGGGAVLDPGTRELLVASEAPVVWLEVGLSAGLERVGLARARPVLAMNPRARLSQLLTERLPLYAEVSDVRILTDGRTPEEIVAEIVAEIARP
jgi:shikimate kinase